MTATTPDGLARLREPFAANQNGKLPKPYKSDSAKGNCKECGGYHGLPAMHLDYVGHAALTDRFLDADPMWSWEPMGVTEDGLPAIDKDGGLWIRLTICGVTRIGYGDAQGKKGPNATKEAIGDALRNAGMRFGAALDLWHKGDLHDVAQEQGQQPAETAVVDDADEALFCSEAIGSAETTGELTAAASRIAVSTTLGAAAKAKLRAQYTARLAELNAAVKA